MTLTLELTDDQERQIQESVDRQDEAMVREVLLEALEEVVGTILQRAEKRARTDTVAETLARRTIPADSQRTKQEIDQFLRIERESWD